MNLLFAAGVAIVAAAPAPSVGLPEYQPGDAFIYSNGAVEQVRSVRDGVVTWSGLSGPSWSRPSNVIAPVLQWKLKGREGKRTMLGAPDTLWPLRKGQMIRFRVLTEARRSGDPAAAWNRSVSLWSCQVGAPALLKAPVGEFESWPIRCDRFSASNMRPIEQVSWDYAPDIGHYLRRTTVTYRTGRRREVWLVAALHGPTANRDRLEALARPWKALAKEKAPD